MRALISVYDKTGVAEFAGQLAKLGWEIVSTGGTYKLLSKEGIKAVKISYITGTPEMLEGRVKTLHPNVFGGILARKDQQEELEKYDIPRFDLVCCNLYPFEEAAEKYDSEKEVLENIDIGGVTLIRAAAKNYSQVLVVTDPEDYAEAAGKISKNDLQPRYRRQLALKAFERIAEYDLNISRYFSKKSFKPDLEIKMPKAGELRYGENPHQKAALYGDIPYEKIQGEKELSFNNIQDLEAAANIVKSFSSTAAVIIKHAVPCGAATGKNCGEAYKKALAGDPMSAFGGIVGFNARVDSGTASKLTEHFFEVIVAPEFDPEALRILSDKKNLRIVKYKPYRETMDYRRVSNGFLVQDMDDFKGEEWQTVSQKQPDEKQMNDLKFAWKIVRFLKSNAAAIVKDGQTRGLGSGETARVTAVEVAAMKMKKFFEEDGKDLIMASDGFFPFPDGVEKAAEAGVACIIQPGGSRNDEVVIKKADELGIVMVFAGRRHFLH